MTYKVDRLIAGDMFGEIGLLTNLSRTATIMSDDNCLVLSLDRSGLNTIQKQFPSIFINMFDNMKFYKDNDMIQRFQFINNIPFMRKLDEETLCKIVYKITEHYNYEIGDLILSSGVHSPNIFIVAEGVV